MFFVPGKRGQICKPQRARGSRRPASPAGGGSKRHGPQTAPAAHALSARRQPHYALIRLRTRVSNRFRLVHTRLCAPRLSLKPPSWPVSSGGPLVGRMTSDLRYFFGPGGAAIFRTELPKIAISSIDSLIRWPTESLSAIKSRRHARGVLVC